MGLVAPPVEVIQFDTRGRPFLFLKDQTAPRVTKLGYFGERVPKLGDTRNVGGRRGLSYEVYEVNEDMFSSEASNF